MKKFHEITLAEDSAFPTKEGLVVYKKGQTIRVYEGEEEKEEDEVIEEEVEDGEEEKSDKTEEGKK